MRMILLALAMAAAAPASAQETPPTQGDDVVVTGVREREEAARDVVDALSGSRSFTVDTDPIGRLDDRPVCPQVVGLSAERNAAIAARIRQVAGAARMRIAPADCRANVLVVLTRDKEEMVRELRRAHPAFFRNGAGQVISVPPQPGPVVVWHVERMVDRFGQPVPFDVDLGFYVLNSPTVPSRISAQMRPVFAAAVVVIELEGLIGLSATQIADYAAMRAFTQADPAQVRGLGVPTILTAIEAPEGTAVPVTLTQWDLSYLRALIATPNFHYAQRQRAALRQRMLRELDDQTGNSDRPDR